MDLARVAEWVTVPVATEWATAIWRARHALQMAAALEELRTTCVGHRQVRLQAPHPGTRVQLVFYKTWVWRRVYVRGAGADSRAGPWTLQATRRLRGREAIAARVAAGVVTE